MKRADWPKLHDMFDMAVYLCHKRGMIDYV